MPWNYKNRKRPNNRLKFTPANKKVSKITKMVKPFNYKSPRKDGGDGSHSA